MTGAIAKPKRRWLQIGLMALPAILVLAPLLALIVAGTGDGFRGGFSINAIASHEPFEHGWPFPFLKRIVYLDNTSSWAIWQGKKEWYLAGAAGDAAIFLSATIVVTVLSIRRARQNRLWRVTIREGLTFMLLISIVAVHLGWCLRRGEHALTVGWRLTSLHAYVNYEYCGPKWLQRLRSSGLAGAMEGLPLASIRSVDLDGVQRADMEEASNLLAEIERPHKVRLESIVIDEPLLLLVLESLTKCQPEELSLAGIKLKSFMGEPWSAELLEPLARNPCLRKLNFDGTGIGDSELTAILQCRHLRSIDLCSTQVTAKGVQSLLELPNLEELAISEAALSDELQKQAAEAGVRLDVAQRLWSK